MSKISQLQEIITNSDNIVFFGGAGVSTESGIPDFRSESGIFKSLEKYGDTPENLVSHSYYIDHTEEFFEYYKENLIFEDATPNPAHLKLAELEKTGKIKAVITQNIDGLHQKAGSKNVLELHGSVHRNYCQICGKEYDLKYILESIQNAETLIIGGTSLVVYPAAGLINYFSGKNLILINKSETPYDNLATLVINDAIGEVFSQIKI